jgi:hypothetical protein
MLKGPRVTINPSQIIDPVSKTVMFEEKVEIETCLSEHFSKIGTDNPLHILGTHLVYHRYREPYQF